jgi:hypothetical protein
MIKSKNAHRERLVTLLIMLNIEIKIETRWLQSQRTVPMRLPVAFSLSNNQEVKGLLRSTLHFAAVVVQKTNHSVMELTGT